MHVLIRAVAIPVLLLTSACSTLLEGRTQTIAVDSFPTGADCLIKDNDTVLARVHTPGTAQIEKSKNDILVECTKEGYIPNKQRNRSDMAISGIANMAFGQWSFVGNMVDSASGASHKYDSKVFLPMNALPPVALVPAEGAPSPFAAAAIAAPDGAANLAGLPADQLAQQLALLFKTGNVVVSQQSPDEVIRLLAANRAVTDNAPGAPAQQMVADRTPIQHSAE